MEKSHKSTAKSLPTADSSPASHPTPFPDHPVHPTPYPTRPHTEPPHPNLSTPPQYPPTPAQAIPYPSPPLFLREKYYTKTKKEESKIKLSINLESDSDDVEFILRLNKEELRMLTPYADALNNYLGDHSTDDIITMLKRFSSTTEAVEP